MNNLPLQPLKWFDYKDGTGADTVTVICEYTIYRYGDELMRDAGEIQSDGDHDSWVVAYYNRHTEAPTKEATGFATIDEAKAWAWNHYNEKMQPYVKPLSTWIDVNERLPEEDGLYLAYYPDQTHKQQIVFFSSNINRFNYFHDLVTHWQLLPNPPEGE